MKKLFIIRHAKSSWMDSSLSDFDRPLNKRGKRDAPFMGKLLKSKKVSPDIIISSPAKRAKKTAKIVAKEIDFTKAIIYNEKIYEADINTIEHILHSISDENNIAFIFGHNPELNMLVESFVDFRDNLPTLGVVEIEFDSEQWSDISSKNAKLISFEYPKKHNVV